MSKFKLLVKALELNSNLESEQSALTNISKIDGVWLMGGDYSEPVTDSLCMNSACTNNSCATSATNFNTGCENTGCSGGETGNRNCHDSLCKNV